MATQRKSSSRSAGSSTSARKRASEVKAPPRRTKQPPRKAKKAEAPSPRFDILVCVDGSEESQRALKYAVRLGSGTDADLVLLYVRPLDQGLGTGGLQISVTRENLLRWGLDMPGMDVLKRARDWLVELEFLNRNWPEELKHTDVQGDPVGDNVIVYKSDEGRSVCLKLVGAASVAQGILDECERGDHDLVIIGKSMGRGEPAGLGYIAPDVADAIAMEHTGTVLVTRGIEENHGHLVCVWNDEKSIAAAERDAEIAARCACPVHLYAVAPSESELGEAKAAMTKARKAIERHGIRLSSEKVDLGDPADRIIEEGRGYSVIVLAAPERGWRRFFRSSVADEVLRRAYNSVMIAR